MHLQFIDIAIIVAFLATSVCRLLGFASRLAEHQGLLPRRQRIALVPARRLERLGYVRHRRHDAACHLALRLWHEECLDSRLWPVFNQIFLMVDPSGWLRRSGVTTGAEWIKFRFGNGLGAQLSHLIVVLFALVSVIGFLSYGFKGIGKFAVDFLPWHRTHPCRRNKSAPACAGSASRSAPTRRPLRLSGQRQTLMHAEAVLFVDDGEREIVEGDLFLKQRVGADQRDRCRRAPAGRECSRARRRARAR